MQRYQERNRHQYNASINCRIGFLIRWIALRNWKPEAFWSAIKMRHLLLWNDYFQDDFQTWLWKEIRRYWHWLPYQIKNQGWILLCQVTWCYEEMFVYKRREKNGPSDTIWYHESYWKRAILYEWIQAKNIPFRRSS